MLKKNLFLLVFLIAFSLYSQNVHALNTFDVNWNLISDGISHKVYNVSVQNLEVINQDFNLSILFSDTNFNLEEIRNVYLAEWKNLTYEYQEWMRNVTCELANITPINESHLEEYTEICEDDGWFEDRIGYKCQYKSSKMAMFKKADKLESYYVNINIPKYNSKDKDCTFNGTKSFKLEFDVPVIKTDQRFGSYGKVAFYENIEGKEYHPYWNASFEKARAFQVNETQGIQRTNDVVIADLTIIYPDLQADCDDIRIVKSDNLTEIGLNFTTGATSQESDLICCSASCVLVRFPYNTTAYQNQTFFIYFNYSTAESPNSGLYSSKYNRSELFLNSTEAHFDVNSTTPWGLGTPADNDVDKAVDGNDATTRVWYYTPLPVWGAFYTGENISFGMFNYSTFINYEDLNFTIAFSWDNTTFYDLQDDAFGVAPYQKIRLYSPVSAQYWKITITKTRTDNYNRNQELYFYRHYQPSTYLGSEAGIPPPDPIIAPLVVCFETKPICVKLDDNTIYYFDNININGNMHVSLNLPISYPYLFAHTNNTINVASAGVWYNVTFDEQESLPKSKIYHTYNDETNDTFTITENGYYDISYSMSFADSQATPLNHIVIRAVKNGDEIEGTLLEEDSTKQYSDFTISNGAFIYLVTGDEIKFQFTSDATTVNLTSHRTYGDHHDTAIIKIKRIA